MKRQSNVNENLLQSAFKESQDTNIFQLSFESNYLKDLPVKFHYDSHI